MLLTFTYAVDFTFLMLIFTLLTFTFAVDFTFLLLIFTFDVDLHV